MTTKRQEEIDKMTKEQLVELTEELFVKFQDITEPEQIKLWPEYLYVKYKLQLLSKAPSTP